MSTKKSDLDLVQEINYCSEASAVAKRQRVGHNGMPALPPNDIYGYVDGLKIMGCMESMQMAPSNTNAFARSLTHMVF